VATKETALGKNIVKKCTMYIGQRKANQKESQGKGRGTGEPKEKGGKILLKNNNRYPIERGAIRKEGKRRKGLKEKKKETDLLTSSSKNGNESNSSIKYEGNNTQGMYVRLITEKGVFNPKEKGGQKEKATTGKEKEREREKKKGGGGREIFSWCLAGEILSPVLMGL